MTIRTYTEAELLAYVELIRAQDLQEMRDTTDELKAVNQQLAAHREHIDNYITTFKQREARLETQLQQMIEEAIVHE